MLHSVIAAKKFKTWSKVLEDVVIKYIQICVETRNAQMAKDGLHQFRVTSQNNVDSLENVVKVLLSAAQERAKEAQSEAEHINEVADLEAEESVETLMFTSVSGEGAKDRTDREVVTPWLSFLWETYRTILEILRSNSKLENLYQVSTQTTTSKS